MPREFTLNHDRNPEALDTDFGIFFMDDGPVAIGGGVFVMPAAQRMATGDLSAVAFRRGRIDDV